jgi:hypothetical protein
VANEKAIQEGQEVRRFLESGTVMGAVELVRRAIYDRWRLATEPAVREKLWAQQSGLEEVMVMLKTIADRGTLEEKVLEREVKQQEAEEAVRARRRPQRAPEPDR